MTRAHLLSFNLTFLTSVLVEPTAVATGWRRSALGRPSRGAVAVRVDAGQQRGGPGEVAVGLAAVWRGQKNGAVAVGGQVLVELVDVESANGGDDVGAELGDVQVAEVNVLPPNGGGGAGAAVPVFVPHVRVRFRGCGWRWRSVRLTWKPKPREAPINIILMHLHNNKW